MSENTPKTIILRGGGYQLEGLALAALMPGALLVRTGDDVAPAAADSITGPYFAIERTLDGGTLDRIYEEEDQVLYQAFNPGSRVYALLPAGEEVTPGALLGPAANGHLQVAGTGLIVGQAVDAVDNGDGEGPVRIRVDILSPFVIAEAPEPPGGD